MQWLQTFLRMELGGTNQAPSIMSVSVSNSPKLIRPHPCLKPFNITWRNSDKLSSADQSHESCGVRLLPPPPLRFSSYSSTLPRGPSFVPLTPFSPPQGLCTCSSAPSITLPSALHVISSFRSQLKCHPWVSPPQYPPCCLLYTAYLASSRYTCLCDCCLVLQELWAPGGWALWLLYFSFLHPACACYK